MLKFKTRKDTLDLTTKCEESIHERQKSREKAESHKRIKQKQFTYPHKKKMGKKRKGEKAKKKKMFLAHRENSGPEVLPRSVVTNRDLVTRCKPAHSHYHQTSA